MKITILTTIIVVALLLILPIPPPHADGAFNSISGLIWCSDEASCLHEIGHKLDKEAGWISKTDEFGMAIKVFLQWQYQIDGKPSEFVDIIIHSSGLFEFNGYFDNPQAEIYANIFKYADGKQENIPELFRKFYDWKTGYQIIQVWGYKLPAAGD